MNEAQRAWAYRVMLALTALAVIYGVVSDEQAAGWVAVITAILGNGLAAKNTPTGGDE